MSEMMECGHLDINLVESLCSEKPELLIGQPIGMYHCPDCGEMVLAGMPHPKVCVACYQEQTGRRYGSVE